MSDPNLVDDSLLEDIRQAVGRELALSEVVSARRGATVARLHDQQQAFAVKVASTADASPAAAYKPAELLLREAQNSRLLGDITGDTYVASGASKDRRWLLTRWLEARSSPIVVRRIRQEFAGVPRRQKLLGVFLVMLGKVRALHERGYVHGDLQPDHFYIGEQGEVYLLDLALTKRAGDDFAYKGGLVHFNSPEVCAQMLAGSDNIPLDPLSEVYSAASVVFFLYTNHTAANYGTDDYKAVPMAERLRCIAAGRRNSFSRVAAESFPELERVLDWCLQVDRSRRCPDLAQAIDGLEQAIALLR